MENLIFSLKYVITDNNDADISFNNLGEFGNMLNKARNHLYLNLDFYNIIYLKFETVEEIQRFVSLLRNIKEQIDILNSKGKIIYFEQFRFQMAYITINNEIYKYKLITKDVIKYYLNLLLLIDNQLLKYETLKLAIYNDGVI
jgi:hypothetical protein